MENRLRRRAPDLSPGLADDPRTDDRIGAAPGRLLVGPPVAIIDIGSNSVRLVAYEGLTRAPTPLYNERVLCGLGRHVATTGRLDEAAMERALMALARFRVLCDTMRVRSVRALATAAAREAANGPEFLEAAAMACGHPIELVPGAREAELAALGVISGFFEPQGLVGDLGGGSLELVDVAGTQTGETASLTLGGLALQDLSRGSVDEAQRIVREALDCAPLLRRLEGRTFYAVGGSWRALARLHQAWHDYPLRVMHGYVLDPGEALDFLRRVQWSDWRALPHVDGISAARRPLLAYAAVVLEEIISAGRARRVVVSALGLREGVLFEELDADTKRRDPLLCAASDLNLLRSRSPRHCEELCAWTDHFVASAGLAETGEQRRLRHAACLLADVGWRAHPDYRGEQSVNLIANAAFIGIDHPGRAFLALSVFFRHEGLSLERASARLVRLAGPELAERARLLGALMRVAYAVSAAMEGVLPRAPLSGRGRELVLQLPADLSALASERLDNRLRQLTDLTALEPRITVA